MGVILYTGFVLVFAVEDTTGINFQIEVLIWVGVDWGFRGDVCKSERSLYHTASISHRSIYPRFFNVTSFKNTHHASSKMAKLQIRFFCYEL